MVSIGPGEDNGTGPLTLRVMNDSDDRVVAIDCSPCHCEQRPTRLSQQSRLSLVSSFAHANGSKHPEELTVFPVDRLNHGKHDAWRGFAIRFLKLSLARRRTIVRRQHSFCGSGQAEYASLHSGRQRGNRVRSNLQKIGIIPAVDRLCFPRIAVVIAERDTCVDREDDDSRVGLQQKRSGGALPREV